ncbi:hypothetical protein GWK47_031166 [Chionoecetes opilio]|uniref:Uncharacterized protein n=1 Tax=Chionoecetes opilio TaxID=41210 RepID=A0A8J4YR91_CHIOP|nr:hypothetical protein GWK47_031166 [Chionoecetes opilio]
MAEKTWWAPREVNLPPFSCCCHPSFVIFSSFRTRSRGSGASPSRRVGVWTKKVDESAHSAVAELPVTNSQTSLPSPKSLLTPFSFLLLSAANLSCFLDSFAMLSLGNSTHYHFPLAPLVVEEVLVLLFEVDHGGRSGRGLRWANMTPSVPGGGRRRLVPSD